MKYLFALAAIAAVGTIIVTALASPPPTMPVAKLTATTPGPATGCRYFDGTRGPCKPAPYCGLSIGNVPACDIDGQPRTEPYPPTGCTANVRADVGADEYYAPGCEPLVTVFGAPSYCPGIDRQYIAAWAALSASTTYKTWAKTNAKEAAAVSAFVATPTAAVPASVTTYFGKALLRLVQLDAITRC